MWTILIHRSSDPTELLIFCALGFCAGIALFLYGFRLLQRRRLILDTPFSKIRSASLGLVEVSGLAVGPFTVQAPITGRPCYYYRTLVWEWKQSGKNKSWVKIAGECMHVPFFVDDNTGRVLIDPRGADLDLHRDFHDEFNGSFFSTFNDAPANVSGFLARHGIHTSNRVKVEEYCIKPKNALFILGTLGENPDLEVSPEAVEDHEAIDTVSTFGRSGSSISISFSIGRDAAREMIPFVPEVTAKSGAGVRVIRLSQDASLTTPADGTQQQKVAAALIKAGIANPTAWAAAGLAAPGVQVKTDPAAVVHRGGAPQASSPNEFDLHPPVVLKKGTNNKTFLISWRSQREVARALGWKCMLMIWGGPVLALLSLYFFLGIRALF